MLDCIGLLPQGWRAEEILSHFIAAKIAGKELNVRSWMAGVQAGGQRGGHRNCGSYTILWDRD